MAGDNVLGSVSIEITGDTTRLLQDFAKAQAAGKTAGVVLSAAFIQATQAAQRLAEAGAAFGPAIAAGNAVAIAAVSEYQTELLAATVALEAEIAAVNQDTAAKTRNAGATRQATEQVRSFVGVLPGFGIAAERFVGLLPGLGGIIMSAFPVFGAIAFGEALFRIGEHAAKLSPELAQLEAAEKNLEKVTESTNREFDHLSKTFEKLQVERATLEIGKAAGQRIAAFISDSDVKDEEARIRYLGDLIERTQKKIAQEAIDSRLSGNPLLDLNPLITGMKFATARDAQAESKNVQAYQLELDVIKERLRVSKEQTKVDQDHASKDAAEESERAWERQKRAFEEYKHAQDEITRSIERRQDALDREAQKLHDLTQRVAVSNRETADKFAEAANKYADVHAKLEAANTKRPFEPKPLLEQTPIDIPIQQRIKGPLGAGIALSQAGFKTIQEQQSQIKHEQELLTLMREAHSPLGQQLALRQSILQAQIALDESQGKSTAKQLADLDKIRRQVELIHRRSVGAEPLSRALQLQTDRVPGAVAGGLTKGIIDGKHIGQDIRESLKGIGQEMLGTVLKQLIDQIIIATGVQTIMTAVFSANTIATIANTVATWASAIAGIFGFAEGGRPPVGVASIVGERGPELFIPDAAGQIVPAGQFSQSAFSGGGTSRGGDSFHFHGPMAFNGVQDVRGMMRSISEYAKNQSLRRSPYNS